MRRSGPPFQSVRGAVRWAFFTVRRPLLKNTSIYHVGPASDDELTAMDKRAQAALIVGKAERLLAIEQLAFLHVVWLKPGKLTLSASARRRNRRVVIEAKILNWDMVEDKVDRGERLSAAEQKVLAAGGPLAERDAMPDYFLEDAGPEMWRCLVSVVRTELGMTVGGRGLERLLRRCRGDAIGVHAVRKDLHCAMADVEAWEGRARDVLQKFDDQVTSDLYLPFMENRWIEMSGH